MAKNIWITSDTHFNHANILNFEDSNSKKFRGDLFDDVNHMNEVMIENWNKIVKSGDKVYHLGDVFFGPKEDFQKMWPRLNGQKRLVVGNHDDIKYLSSGGFFAKVEMWRIFKDFGLILTHVPIHVDNFRHAELNVHGHIHQNPSPSGPYKCVCVEQTDYTPVNIEDLRVK